MTVVDNWPSWDVCFCHRCCCLCGRRLRCRWVDNNSCRDCCRRRRHLRRRVHVYFYSHFRCANKLGFLRLSWASLFGIFPWRTTQTCSLFKFKCLRVFPWKMTRASFFRCSCWCVAKILDKCFFRMLYVGPK